MNLKTKHILPSISTSLYQQPSVHLGVSVPTGLMGKQNNDPVVRSSIALLQERFRQLQRVKERREERELMRAPAAQRDRLTSSAYSEQPNWFFHPDLVHPSRPLHGTPSQQPDVQGNHPEFNVLETSLSISLWPNKPRANGSVHCNETDVDTSLHL